MSDAASPAVPPSVRPVDLRDYTAFDQTAARRVRVYATDVLSVDLWCLEPRQSTSVLRYDDVDVAYTVLGGNGWFVTDQGELGLGPLGAMLVPSGVAHGIDNRTADPLVVLASASPPDGSDGAGAEPPVTPSGAAVHRPGERRGLRRRLRDLLGG
jgi:quercetin dioxygenase-like cupin family protein